MSNKEMISMIAVLSREKRALGLGNNLLWKIEGDLPRFKALTTGHPIIMGRKTFESIGRPLPNRTNIVISKSLQNADGRIVVNSFEKALHIAREKAKETGGREIFIIGGGQIYAQAFPYADRLYLTLVDDEPEADTFFPDYSEFRKEIKREEHRDHNPPFIYRILEK